MVRVHQKSNTQPKETIMNRSTTIIRGAFLVAVTAAALQPLTSAPATAFAPAASTVSIQAQGTDLYGMVTSSRPSCELDRKVVVFKQKGERGGSDDKRVASDTTDDLNGGGEWSTGNTGMAGRFYAKVVASSDCKAAVSGTIKVERE